MLIENFVLKKENVQIDCQMIVLNQTHFKEVYAIDIQAFKELDGQYIEKTEQFIEDCLISDCSVGVISAGRLVAIVTANIEKIVDKNRAEILGFNADWPNAIGFIEGVYVFPDFRKQGLISKLYRAVIKQFEGKGVAHIYSAIDPRNKANIIAMTKSKFYLQNLYHSNINGDLRYLVKYYPEDKELTDEYNLIATSDYEVQRICFNTGNIGVSIEVDNIVFKKRLKSV